MDPRSGDPCAPTAKTRFQPGPAHSLQSALCVVTDRNRYSETGSGVYYPNRSVLPRTSRVRWRTARKTTRHPGAAVTHRVSPIHVLAPSLHATDSGYPLSRSCDSLDANWRAISITGMFISCDRVRINSNAAIASMSKRSMITPFA